MNQLTARLEHDPSEGWWTAQCVELPAAISQGRTAEEAKEGLKDAIGLVLAEAREGAARTVLPGVRLEAVEVGV